MDLSPTNSHGPSSTRLSTSTNPWVRPHDYDSELESYGLGTKRPRPQGLIRGRRLSLKSPHILPHNLLLIQAKRNLHRVRAHPKGGLITSTYPHQKALQRGMSIPKSKPGSKTKPGASFWTRMSFLQEE
ncbi:hypothetical protein DCAR_0205606 [Daucus carota subsp. sativus]|uniref:Uncharacterized protein n=1 Tax=Daucus carota subsp. sativus TaxID=79200 RepID=A0A161XCL4_DAUCS|nr:hypothetical protein DCAR_0205606 [Daucus carota subsp. sativus]